MSSKLFPWTKGERQHSAHAPRSEDHIGWMLTDPIHGKSGGNERMARLPRSAPGTNRRHLSKSSSRANYSISLQDAAIRSATSLSSGGNETRSSSSTSLLSRPRSSEIPPSRTRPRSHTAPPTPLGVIPATMEPVELPGSLLIGMKSISSLRNFGDEKDEVFPIQPQTIAKLGVEILRPHSTPQGPSLAIPRHPRHPRKSMDSYYDATSSLELPFQPYVRSKSASPQLGSTKDVPVPSHFAEQPVSDSASIFFSSKLRRPPPHLLPSWQSPNVYPSASVAISENGSANSLHGVGISLGEEGTSYLEHSLQPTRSNKSEGDTTLFDQMLSMRLSHESQMSTLKEAHEKELTSLRSYVAFVEQYRGLPPATNPSSTVRKLSIDASQSGAQVQVALAFNASSTALFSDDAALETQKPPSADIAAELEAVKRKLSLSRKAQADVLEIRRERDDLRDGAEKGDRKIVQLKDIVCKAKTNEKAMQNAMIELEARLATAKNERLDVLEGYREACGKVAALAARERHLTQELAEVKERLSVHLPNSKRSTLAVIGNHSESIRPRHNRTVSDIGGGPWNENASREIQVLQDLVMEKTARIEQLEQCALPGVPHLERISEMESLLEEQRKISAQAQASADRYNSLLHNEIRRQAQQAVPKVHTASSKIEAEAFALAADKMVRLTAQRSTNSSVGARVPTASEQPPPAGFLERELEHYIKEIILYKFDLRNYRAELRKANAKIESLQRQTDGLRAPTSNSEHAPGLSSSVADPRAHHPRGLREHPVEHRSAVRPGLGISLPQITPSPHSVASATATALLSTTPSAFPTLSPTHPARPKTPLNAHKKLPRPPPDSRTPSPLPASLTLGSNTSHGETQRSSSESILPSEARRPSPEGET